MKINILDAHDRLKEFKKQSDYISQGCQDCINNRPQEFGNHSFYIFAHKRELGWDERIAIYNGDLQNALLDLSHKRQYHSVSQTPTHRMIWVPRLLKPAAQTNSMLFKYRPENDLIEIIWMIPDRALWEQYTKGNLTEHKDICESIYKFNNKRQSLESRESDDLSDEKVNSIYSQISLNARYHKQMRSLYTMPNSEEKHGT